jgi:putative salt-induced outer membrane protein YdiY
MSRGNRRSVIALAVLGGNERALLSVMAVNGARMLRADDQGEDMTSFKIFAAALLLSAFAAAPASAWQALDEPAAYSFSHPNEDPLNAGPSPSSSNAMASTLRSNPVATTHMSVRPRRSNSTAAVKRY